MEELLILKEPINNISDSRDLFNKIKGININYKQENFIVFYLNTKNQLIETEVLFKGGLNYCAVDSKTLFRNALIKNSNAIIIAHNHPSGDLNPSYEDKEIYDKLKQAGEILQLRVLDSIIFNEKEFYSLK